MKYGLEIAVFIVGTVMLGVIPPCTGATPSVSPAFTSSQSPINLTLDMKLTSAEETNRTLTTTSPLPTTSTPATVSIPMTTSTRANVETSTLPYTTRLPTSKSPNRSVTDASPVVASTTETMENGMNTVVLTTGPATGIILGIVVPLLLLTLFVLLTLLHRMK
eukprot:scpid105110/ scgid29526/ 